MAAQLRSMTDGSPVICHRVQGRTTPQSAQPLPPPGKL